MGLVYLVHFEKPLHHARHYVGYTDSLDARMICHQNGNGSKLLRAVTGAGISWDVVRVWRDVDRTFERRIKNQKHSWRHCPVCREERRRNGKGGDVARYLGLDGMGRAGSPKGHPGPCSKTAALEEGSYGKPQSEKAGGSRPFQE
jgi:predicted GIY-YIG superfamily endonuclease